jgi:hypothetical protein
LNPTQNERKKERKNEWIKKCNYLLTYLLTYWLTDSSVKLQSSWSFVKSSLHWTSLERNKIAATTNWKYYSLLDCVCVRFLSFFLSFSWITSHTPRLQITWVLWHHKTQAEGNIKSCSCQRLTTSACGGIVGS